MRRLWLCLFYALCLFTIVFSLFWMALPRLTLPEPSPAEETPVSDPTAEPEQAAQAPASTAATPYYLCDEGGRVAVYRCAADGTPGELLERTAIYVNLLPESDALRIKQGLTVPGEVELRRLLEDLGE